MNILAWILQGILAAMFLMAGFMKLGSPKEKIAEKMAWANDYSAGTIKFIGLAELLGAIGLILPYALGILPILTPIAAAALTLVMVLAIGAHAKKGEKKEIGTNVVLLVLLLAVALLRF